MGKINTDYTEHKLQKEIVKILKLNNIVVIQTDVMIGLRFLHNQRDRILFIQEEKQLGYFKGQADLIILLNKRVVFVEIKNGKKGVQSDTQKEFENICKSRNLEYYVWRDLQDCINFINDLKENE